MIDSYGRALYQKVVVDPFLPHFSLFSPLLLTFSALITGMSVAPLLAFHYAGFALVLLCISGILDTVDGSVARFKNRTSPLGAALDITGDRMVEFSVVLGLYLYQPETRGLNCLLMLGSILVCITTFLVVGIFIQNNQEKSFYYSPGIIERAEAFIFFGMMILFPETFWVTSSLFTGLVFLTAFVRLYQFRKAG